MQIKSLELEKTNFQLTRPVKFLNKYSSLLPGIKLIIEYSDHSISFAEQTYLQEFSTFKNFEEYFDHCQLILPKLIGLSLQENPNYFCPHFNLINLPYNELSYLIESNFLNRFENINPSNLTTSKLFYFDYNHSIESNLNNFNQLATNSSCIKIKIGTNISFELEFFKKLKNKSPLLRIDGNQLLSLFELEEYLKIFHGQNIEYIEEPLVNMNEWKHDLPLALDFLWHQYKTDFKNLKVVILKPSVIGSFSKTLSLIEELHKKEIRTILSSAFDPLSQKINFSFLLQKHFNLTNKNEIHGLDSFNFF